MSKTFISVLHLSLVLKKKERCLNSQTFVMHVFTLQAKLIEKKISSPSSAVHFRRGRTASHWTPTTSGPRHHLWPLPPFPVQRSKRSSVHSAVQDPPAGRSAAWSELRPLESGRADGPPAQWRPSATGWRFWTVLYEQLLQGQRNSFDLSQVKIKKKIHI